MKEEKEINLIGKLLLERLINMDKWGGAHSELNRVVKSLPSYLKMTNQGKKKVHDAIKMVVKNEFLLSKPSTGEIHVSLNPRKKKEIFEFIENNERKL